MNFDNNKMQDIAIWEKDLLNQYKQLWLNHDWQGIADFLNYNLDLKYKIFNAENWNRIKNTLNSDNAVEIDYDYRNGDSSLNFDFVDEMSPSIPQEIMSDAQAISNVSMDFAYAGVWQNTRGYRKNEMVTIDDYHLFYCIQAHEASEANKPTSTNGNQYWVLCKGFLGTLGNQGIAVSQTQPAILDDLDVWIETIPEPATLLSGQEFSAALFSVVGNLSYIKTISFSNTLPTLWQPQQVVVSTSNSSEQIIAYCEKSGVTGSNNYKIVVYCPNTIYANANCNRMFNNYSNCISFDFGNFDTSKVSDMSMMFLGCSSVQCLNLNNFDTSKVTNMTSMFSLCTSLRGIYVGNSWTTDAVTSGSQMFYNCSNLSGVGSDGRIWDYNSSYIDASSANIGSSSSTIPNYLSLSKNIITISYDNSAFNNSGTIVISQNNRTILNSVDDIHWGENDELFINVDFVYSTTITHSDLPNWTECFVVNGSQTVVSQSDTKNNYSLTVPSHTPYTNINIISTD